MRTLFTFLLLALNFQASAQLVTESSYVVGQQSSRVFINANSLSQIPSNLFDHARATAQFGHGSAFYIKGAHDKHYMLAAAHTALSKITPFSQNKKKEFAKNSTSLCKVFPDSLDSEPREFYLGLLNVYYTCKKLMFISEEYDIAVFEVDVAGQPTPKSYNLRKSFDSFEAGSSIAMMSYSRTLNFKNDLVFSTDNDCKTFGDLDELIERPDQSVLTGEFYASQAVAVGCDFLPGDSGGPLINVKTGQLIGFVLGSTGDSLRSIGESNANLFESFKRLDKNEQIEIMVHKLPQISPIEPVLKNIIDLIY